MRLIYAKPILHDLSQESRIAFVRQFRHMSQDKLSDKLGLTGKCKRRKSDRYEIISGHRRKRAYELLGKSEIECITKNISDDEAIIEMVDSNLSREKVLPSEKAFPYKMKLDALKHQGKTCGTECHKSRDVIGEESGRQIQNYIRLTYIIKELLDLIDNSAKVKIKDALTIGIKPAVEMSYLTKVEQKLLYETINFYNKYKAK